jgi:hypothetical protein
MSSARLRGVYTGELGLPCRDREHPVNVICVVIDAPGDVTSALSKARNAQGVSTNYNIKSINEGERHEKLVSILMIAVLALSLLGAAQAKTQTPETIARTDGRSCYSHPGSDGNGGRPETKPTEEATTIRIGGTDGATSIGMVKLMEDAANEVTENKYEFTVAGSADELTPKLIQGGLDIAAIPANLASVSL